MTEKPTYEELEKRVAELERQVDQPHTVALQHPLDMLSVLMAVFRYIPLCQTFEDAARKIFDQCKQLTGARSGYVALLSGNGKENEVLFLDAGGMPCDVDPDLSMPIRGLRETAYQTKNVVYDNAFPESPWMKYLPDRHMGLDNVLFAPLNIDDNTVGVIGIANKPGGFNEQDIQISKILGDLAAVALTYARAKTQLKNSEELFKTLFDQAAVGIAQVTTDGRFIRVNSKFAGITGYSKDELARMCFDEITYPDDLNKEKKTIDLVLKRKIDTFEIEKRYIHKRGHLVWVRLYSNAVTDEKGDIQYALASVIETVHRTKHGKLIPMEVSIQNQKFGDSRYNCVLGRDISDRKQNEEEREKLQAQLTQVQKLESIGSLAGGIAHDFNNLLFPIVGISEMMLDDFVPGSPEHNDAMQIYKAGKRGRALVQQILSFSRQSEQQLIPVHIQKVLKEALKLSRATIPADIPITRDIQMDCLPVMADPTRIHQIAMNLITNAYHAVEPTRGAILIQLKETTYHQNDTPADQLESGAYAMLSVCDTGTGIDPAIMDKIFDPYFTTKKKGKGTGLGLATVYGIVKSCGGDIRVHSDIGKGTTFHVYLPLLEKFREIECEKDISPLPTGTGHILLVDDEPSIVRLEKQMIERLGYQTSSFTSSVDALAAFETDPSQFDLVITDMHMPNLTGVQLAKKMIAARPAFPVILCTGFSESIDWEKTQAMGIKGLLMKPVGMKDLAQKIQDVLVLTD